MENTHFINSELLFVIAIIIIISGFGDKINSALHNKKGAVNSSSKPHLFEIF
jgi:hypothetical protein